MPKAGVAYQLPVEPDDAYRGGKNSKVTIVEAFEFACPYCAMVAPTLDALAEQYKPEDLKIVQKHFIVHPDIATNAAYASFEENMKGMLAPGMLADMVRLEKDITVIPAPEIKDVTVLTTWVGGKVVYQK